MFIPHKMWILTQSYISFCVIHLYKHGSFFMFFELKNKSYHICLLKFGLYNLAAFHKSRLHMENMVYMKNQKLQNSFLTFDQILMRFLREQKHNKWYGKENCLKLILGSLRTMVKGIKHINSLEIYIYFLLSIIFFCKILYIIFNWFVASRINTSTPR